MHAKFHAEPLRLPSNPLITRCCVHTHGPPPPPPPRSCASTRVTALDRQSEREGMGEGEKEKEGERGAADQRFAEPTYGYARALARLYLKIRRMPLSFSLFSLPRVLSSSSFLRFLFSFLP